MFLFEQSRNLEMGKGREKGEGGRFSKKISSQIALNASKLLVRTA
jgi:hypothetical protein